MGRAIPPRTARLARSQGVMLQHVDPWGTAVGASVGAVLDVLRSLGALPGRRRGNGGVSRRGRSRSELPQIEPVVVLPAEGTGAGRLDLGLPASTSPSHLNFRIRTESTGGLGAPERLSPRLRPGRPKHHGGRRESHRRWTVSLPRSLPAGVHELEVLSGGGRVRSWLIVPPRVRRATVRGSRRDVGVFAPLYALRRRNDLGIGDLGHLRTLVRWAARRGLAFVGTLPLYSTFLDRHFDPSPYRPVSRTFWNVVYLDPLDTPEFARSEEAQRLLRSSKMRAEVRRLRATEYVDFRAVARVKEEIVEALLRTCKREGGERWRSYQRYLQEHPELVRYADFRAKHGRTRTERSRLSGYHMFAQWLMEEQLLTLAREAEDRGVQLYLDLPLGVHPQGWDVEEDVKAFVQGVSIGAPPDRNHPTGQAWGLLPPHPTQIRESGYANLRATLRRLFSVAKLVRLDHVMGLHRLYWVPDGRPPSDGVYVAYRPEEEYAIVALEASRAGAEVVGEDLGTVPPEVRPALRRWGFLRMYIGQLEWDGRTPSPPPPPADALAALNTHDMTPFARFWMDRTFPEANGSPGRRAPLPGIPSPPWAEGTTREALTSALARLARSRARHLLINLEDLWLEDRRQNQPGPTGRGMPNFRRKCRWTLEQVVRSRELGSLLEELVRLRRDPRGRST